MTRWTGSLLVQTNVRPQSSRLMPCWPPPLVSSNVSPGRVEEEALAADRDRLRVRPAGPADVAAADAGRDVDAVVEAPAERVQHPLAGAVAPEAGEDDPPDVGLAVAVGVLQVQEIGTEPTKTPPSQQATAEAIGTSSAKTVLLS